MAIKTVVREGDFLWGPSLESWNVGAEKQLE